MKIVVALALAMSAMFLVTGNAVQAEKVAGLQRDRDISHTRPEERSDGRAIGVLVQWGATSGSIEAYLTATTCDEFNAADKRTEMLFERFVLLYSGLPLQSANARVQRDSLISIGQQTIEMYRQLSLLKFTCPTS